MAPLAVVQWYVFVALLHWFSLHCGQSTTQKCYENASVWIRPSLSFMATNLPFEFFPNRIKWVSTNWNKINIITNWTRKLPGIKHVCVVVVALSFGGEKLHKKIVYDKHSGLIHISVAFLYCFSFPWGQNTIQKCFKDVSVWMKPQ